MMVKEGIMKNDRFKTVFISVMLAVVISIAFSACTNSSDAKDKNESKSQSQVKTTKPDTTTPDSIDRTQVQNSVVENTGPGIFAEYTPAALEGAASTDKIILFFHASWCPTCKTIEKDINANLEDVPSDVKILKVDFDDANDLKEKYGVRQQYTMVQVNNQGEKIGLWTDSFSLEDILDTAV